ncbi:hypothetical protein F4779DRAFT_639702 [Xylariaceae sp. FL0662B]|nr:hypothetical protein F4779DRAFT_639702 [Xylariaceae sp. FL0662B]
MSSRCSFGVEIELLVPWLYIDETDPHQDVPGLAPVLRYRRKDIIGEWDDNDVVFGTIESLLKKYGIFTHITAASSDTFPQDMTSAYANWMVTNDPSVHARGMTAYHWVDLEFVSPVEWDVPAAYDAIAYAMSVLTKTYRIFINPSCGLHVHVGLGREIMPLGILKRVSATLWAAEPLLQVLLHPWRRVNHYSRTLRDFSDMSVILSAEAENVNEILAHYVNDHPNDECVSYIGADVRHGELPISWREINMDYDVMSAFGTTRQAGHYEPFRIEDFINQPGSSKDAADNLDNEAKLRAMEKMKGAPSDIPPEHFKSPRKRSNPRIAMPRYTPDQLQEFVKHLGRHDLFHAESKIKEFRGAEGSHDPQWVTTWAKICVGLVRFAINAPIDALLNVLSHCDTAEKEDGKYDCIDLLDELGLFAEAVVAEERIKKNKEEWGLSYVESDDKSE